MRTRIFRLLAVIGAATVLTLAANSVVSAATGSGFILGRSNSASTITSLNRTTAGPVLNFKTRTAGTAPFTTNARGQVTNLNASLLGGKPAKSFAPASSAIVATAVIDGSNNLVASSGIASYNYAAGPKWYAFTVKAGPFNFADYAVSVTPNCSSVRSSYGVLGQHLLVGFTDPSNNAATCGFSLLVFRSH